jgi:hypothetical protein
LELKVEELKLKTLQLASLMMMRRRRGSRVKPASPLWSPR